MDVKVLKAMVLYVLNNVPDKCIGKHELFKILYFASQKHLVKYGDVMIDDFYAFQYGPVPSALSHYLKGSKNEIMSSILVDSVSKYILSPLEEPDMRYLSKIDVQCLDESIHENSGLNFRDLTQKSHDSAWDKAWANNTGKRGDQMDIIDIAIAAGADEETLECIQEYLDIEAALK
jgi:uncharacterized phage-associated protein